MNGLDAIKLISDWAKWLITIETGAIAIIGAVVRSEQVAGSRPAKALATGAIVCFPVSIAAAAGLLLSLPEIAQYLDPGTNVWLTSDSVLGHFFGLNTQAMAVLEAAFFGLGVICFAALIVAVTWAPSAPRGAG